MTGAWRYRWRYSRLVADDIQPRRGKGVESVPGPDFRVRHRVRVVAEGTWLTVSVDGGLGRSWQALAEA
ncbi:hypothetical protein [Actinokineospora terrae]|uniref:Uncharacterized protein n=1 Tax=Actinokineospora terrae TaxID=155974 RepID=A0A1H9LIX0_9PSEU|nr:hypothetical protein [Actinokineospora terrae]SER11451.1 hypothetical protein SAMN04487818_101628 [Actinokineospora terrae]